MKVNRYGVDWVLIKAWINTELAAYANQLEDPELDFPSTQFMRGQIAALNKLRLEVETVETPQIEEPNYG